LTNQEQLKFFETSGFRNNYLDISRKLNSDKILTPDEFGEKLRRWSKKNSISINTIGLFSGAGGLEIGFEDVGFNIIENVEIEQKFVNSMLSNKAIGNYYENTSIQCLDIHNYSPKYFDKIDFIIGGPPCQSFSSAGRRAAGVRGTNDKRGSLFEEFVRILDEVKPKGFLFENVYGILGAQNGEAIKQITSAFAEIGYNLSYRILDTADYGVPQHRERLILVGLKNQKFLFPKPTHGPDSDCLDLFTASEAISSLPLEEKPKLGLNGRFGHLLNEVPPGLNYSFFTEKMGHPKPIFAWRSKFSDFLYKADPNRPIRTLKASGGQYTGPFHWDNRRFSISELKRLQTFPDNYIIEGNYSSISKQIGNSVPPQFARILAISVLDQVFGITLPFELQYLSEKDELSFRKLKRERTTLYNASAKKALINHNTYSITLIKKYSYKASLSDKFGWLLSDNGLKNYLVNVQLSKNDWKINLKNNLEESSTEVFRILVHSSISKKLFKDVRNVELTSDTFDLRAFTSIWKSFEYELMNNNIKADLVQLNGYYQYKNSLSFSLVFIKQPKENILTWKILSEILNDHFIGKIKPIEYYSDRLDLSKNEIESQFKILRSIGYEIRNTNTNPEIPIGSYLIPYKFPTLTSLSVQLGKNL